MKELKLQHKAVIKAVEVKDNYLIIKGIASMYRTPEGFLQIDRDNELINLDFMDLDSYKKNPILCFQHDWSKPMGRITDIEHKDGALHITAEVHKLTGSEDIYEAVQKGIIKSLSIGTVPHEFVYRDTHDGDILEIARSTLVEISLTTVQSNQEALFDVVAQKSPTISKKTLARQNGMTCDELDGSCAFKQELQAPQKENIVIKKEVNTEAENKIKADKEAADKLELEKVAKEAEDKIKADKEAEDKIKADKEAEVKSTPAPAQLDEASLVAALEKVNEKKEELAKKKEEDDAQAKLEEEAQEKAAVKARIDGAINYITERKDAILNTPDEDFDTAAVEEFYELVSDAAEAVEGKIANIIKAQLTPPAE